MAISNYSTQIDFNKTIGEIQGILAKNGAKKIVVDYNEEGLPSALTFGALLANGQMVFFSLPARPSGVLRAMQEDNVAKKFQTIEQAQRVSWRIIKDWIVAQLALIEAEIAELPEIFLRYAITKQGETLYESIGRDQSFLLTDGSKV